VGTVSVLLLKISDATFGSCFWPEEAINNEENIMTSNAVSIITEIFFINLIKYRVK
jgi:hypothetical protein